MVGPYGNNEIYGNSRVVLFMRAHISAEPAINW
jgi:hypothetical protein